MTNLPAPSDVIAFWIGDAASSAEEAGVRNKMWFAKSEDIDAEIRAKFLPLLETLAAGPLADDWAERGTSERLAAIIVLDQFSRNLFRGSPRAFSQDALALRLCKEGLSLREDLTLSEAERIFFYLPLEHSEDIGDQTRAVEMFSALVKDARSAFRQLAEATLEYAYAHKAVIEQFGRFPHRNAVLARETTPQEAAYLAKPGSGF
ncbi:DUF924 family protein [Hyphomonas sp.]|uniref:DUF924 family protein n=1 Tax=Hyphomonas sp. TaxID=87 RepID=UPI0032ED1841|tara:strand:+ start:10580 stop:11194 length:615 start_codon:yes stop_codon:yes gene_type:complete